MAQFMNVFLVDDDKIANFLSKRIIEKANITDNVWIANDGKEALGLINTHCSSPSDRLSLLLLDLNMPMFNGFEFLEEFELLEKWQKNCVHIIILTTSTNENDIAKTKKFKVNGYLNKPLTEEKLKEGLHIADNQL